MSESNGAGDIVRAIDSRGVGLQVRFARSGDRFAHRLELVSAHSVVPLLTTVEGDNETTWPASPALQQLHIERRPIDGGATSEVALLVGLAGRSHWSLSVEPRVEKAAEPHGVGGLVALEFDAACRVHQLPERLGTTYRLEQPLSGGSAELSGVAASGLRFTIDGGELSMFHLPDAFHQTRILPPFNGDRSPHRRGCIAGKSLLEPSYPRVT